MDEAIGASEEEIRRAGADGGDVRLGTDRHQICTIGIKRVLGGAQDVR